MTNVNLGKYGIDVLGDKNDEWNYDNEYGTLELQLLPHRFIKWMRTHSFNGI